WSYFENGWKPEAWEKKYRFVFVRQKSKITNKGPIQLDLFVPYECGYEFKVIVTNKDVWQGEEVKEAVEQLQGPPCIRATGDDRGAGLAAEFPFFERTSLLRATTEEAHPQFGSGILFRLSLPLTDPKEDWPKRALDLNTLELPSLTRSPFLGSWCAGDHGDQAITFVSCYPNIAYQP